MGTCIASEIPMDAHVTLEQRDLPALQVGVENNNFGYKITFQLNLFHLLLTAISIDKDDSFCLSSLSMLIIDPPPPLHPSVRSS